MAYDNPFRKDFTFPAIAFVGGWTRRIPGWPNRKIKVIDITVSPTVSFVGTTTPARVQAGNGVTANLFADLAVGAAGAGTAVGAVAEANSYSTGLVGLVPGKHIYPASGADVIVTGVAPTGGAPAGAGDVIVTVEYV